MPRFFIVLCALLSILNLHAQNSADQNSIHGNPRALSFAEQYTIHSIILSEERKLNLYLPPSYRDSLHLTYPLIVLLDGGMDEDFHHLSGLMQFLQLPWVNGTPECIFAGVENVDRMRDFTHLTSVPEDLTDYPQSGGSALFMQCMEEEILPFLQNTFRCNGNKTIIGQSLGGLLATELLLKKPHLFNNFLIVSPSLWWNNGELLKQSERIINTWKLPEYPAVYLSWGNEHPVMVEQAAQLSAILKSGRKIDFSEDYLPAFNHGDILHEAVNRGLRKLFETPE